MKLFSISRLSVIAAFFIAASGLSLAASNESAAETKSGKLFRVTEKEAAWAAQARKNYPLQVCVVSDEKLGSMGDSPEYIYRVEGQPDRLVVFCCEGCEEDFRANPGDHLAKLDAAKKQKPAAGNSAK